MTSPCGSVMLTFNGEIYNFKRLRPELEALGHRFRTQTDSEVLAAALAQWGEAALARLEGMFAFAAWFVKDRRLLLARDRTGIKPLVYAYDNQRLVFASELGPLRALLKNPPSLDTTALHHYLAFGHASDSRTLLQGVQRLPSGHLLWADECTPRRYWKLEFRQDVSGPDTVQRIRHQLEGTVRDQMISDRPVALMLSGGLDSSVLAGLMASTGTQVTACTVHYPFSGESEQYNESHFASITARRWGINMEKVLVSEDDVLSHFGDLGQFMDEPNGGPGLLPMYCAFGQIRSLATVVIDGGGADECFGGYRKYLVARAWEATRNWPAPLRKALTSAGIYGESGARWDRLGQDEIVADPQRMFDEQGLSRLLGGRHDADWFGQTVAPHLLPASMPLMSRMQWLDLNNHLVGWGNSLLDRAAMAHGMECREPYQDHRLLDFVLNLRESDRSSWPKEKPLLKQACGDLVAPEILSRRKRGFGVPLKHFLRFGLKDAMTDLLAPTLLKRQGLFEVAEVTRLVDEHLNLVENHAPRLWPLLMFQMWHGKTFPS